MLGQMLITSLVLLLTFVTAALPVMRAQRAKSRRQIHEAYRSVKLRAVRRNYPALRGLSDQEILQRFNVSAAYDNIGR